jgi:hypothetical protein
MTFPEAHIERQATQHNSLPSLLGVDNKQSEKVYGEEKNIFCTGLTKTANENKNILQGHDQPNEPITKKRHLSYVLH